MKYATGEEPKAGDVVQTPGGKDAIVYDIHKGYVFVFRSDHLGAVQHITGFEPHELKRVKLKRVVIPNENGKCSCPTDIMMNQGCQCGGK